MHCEPLEEPDMDSTESWIERCLNESESKRYSSPASLGNMSTDEHEEKENNRASKPHSTPATLQWLEENYEIAEGVCIPRSALYMHYLDFSEKQDTQPVNAASFGKIIRQQFPQLTTRRLGTRGQSKYHYYGIAVKESSQYYDVMYSKKGAAWVNETGKKEVTKQTVAYSPRSKLGTLLPDFPNVKDLNLPASLPEDKVSTFIMMYRTHCQRILDTVQSFLLHFWQGMPPHMLPVLGSPTVVNIVGVCDSILYKAISGVLMPTVLQALPDSLTQVIRKFAKQLDEWLKVALHNLPENLRNINADITFQMLEDWRNMAGKRPGCLKKVAQQFLLMWSCFGTRVIRDMTLHSAPSFADVEEVMITETTPPPLSPVPYSPARSVPSVDAPPTCSPTQPPSPEYTAVTATTVTTSGASPPEGGPQLPCVRSGAPAAPVTAGAQRIPPVYAHREEHGLTHEPGIPAPLHYSPYTRSPAQYPLNSSMSRMESCLMSSTPRLHPAPVAPRWPDVSPANSCYSSPPMCLNLCKSPLGPRRNSEYEHSQHFPGFAYINGEATTGTHCQRILDTVQSFLLHFWQGMPPHMLPVLGSPTVVNIVGVCDSILYKAISGVLMPTVLQALPDSLTQVIRKFAKQLDEWLKVALHNLPENLRNINADITFQMLEDWRNMAGKRPGCLKKVAQQFLLMWSCFGTRVIRDMTLHSAPSFEEVMITETTPPPLSPVPYSPARSVPSVDAPPTCSPTQPPSPEYTAVTATTGAVQSYTWSLTYTVTTSGASPPEGGPQLPCVRSGAPAAPVTAGAHASPPYTGSYNYGSYANQHPHSIQSQYPSLTHEPGIPAPLHYSPYTRSPAQYPLNSSMSRMESCLMSSTPRLHPAPVAPRWPDVSPANSCYSSPPMHSARYASPGDIYTPLGPRRNSEYEHSQHFPGFAYINGEATTGWAK
ncbi:hypothetical protein CRUP_001948 [Coryphaenoides rupestris]|nr:hypothetical protein CRUP_001948 [Coryphaenoides rupestris]